MNAIGERGVEQVEAEQRSIKPELSKANLAERIDQGTRTSVAVLRATAHPVAAPNALASSKRPSDGVSILFGVFFLQIQASANLQETQEMFPADHADEALLHNHWHLIHISAHHEIKNLA